MFISVCVWGSVQAAFAGCGIDKPMIKIEKRVVSAPLARYFIFIMAPFKVFGVCFYFGLAAFYRHIVLLSVVWLRSCLYFCQVGHLGGRILFSFAYYGFHLFKVGVLWWIS